MDAFQLALGTAGMVPVFGEVFDLADAGISYLRGDYIGASLSMAAMVPGIGNVAGAGKLANRLNKVTKGLAPAKRASNKTVLGSYPDYVKLSDELGARRFDVPTEIWKNKMNAAQRWDANRKLLDRMISKGDKVILSNPASSAKPDTSFFREIEYLKSQGYRVSNDGLRMLPPRR